MSLHAYTVAQETDVLVVGAGPAGMAAAAAAASAGADVVVLEAGPDIGGNAVWSTGYLAFVDCDRQTAVGIHDSVDAFLEDCRAILEEERRTFRIQFDEELARLFARESAQTYRELVDRGVEFTRFIRRPLQHRIDRLIAVRDPQMIATAYRGDFARENVTTFLNTSAERLVTNGGTVCGVEAVRADGSPLAINAARGIVLATGGFQANPEMRRRFQADARADTPYLGIDTCRGDGHAMAQAAGADMINMTILAPLVLVASALLEDCIAVDIHGHRFHDETGVYQDRVRALRSVDGEVAYYIFDDVTYGRKRDFVSQLPSAAVQADSIEALARTIGIAPEALAESVQRWNEFLTSGAQEDPLTGRVSLPRAGHGILQPPFHAARMVEGSDFSAGGVATTLSMQAVDVYGEPIDRLFAVGDTAGGFVPSRNLGGIHIGGALTLGRVAGRAAATGELLPSHRTRLFGHHLPGNVHTRLALVDLDTRQDTDE